MRAAVRLGVEHVTLAVPGVHEGAGLLGEGDYNGQRSHRRHGDAGGETDGSDRADPATFHPKALHLGECDAVGGAIHVRCYLAAGYYASGIVKPDVLAVRGSDAHQPVVHCRGSLRDVDLGHLRCVATRSGEQQSAAAQQRDGASNPAVPMIFNRRCQLRLPPAIRGTLGCRLGHP